MLKEFKSFILKGDVVSLSTGIIIGAAFTSIVTAFTKGIVEPLLALAGGGPSPRLTIHITDKVTDVKTIVNGQEQMVRTLKPIELDIGSVIGSFIQFLITAAVIFFVIVKPYNLLMSRLKKSEPAAPAGPSEEVKLLTEIRDSLKR
ncbi:MAG: large conductance mechanosensitive channel protein MscL [Verrucomicrobiaceae bacterium]|nr:MAG: large conductance mechanosensitive channel protein MscL [Verrucomicrobiaceae bacterium]